MKRYICLLFGHKPRGPIVSHPNQPPPFLYQCARCESLLIFDRKRGWVIQSEGET